MTTGMLERAVARHCLRSALRQHELGHGRDEQEQHEEEQRGRRDDVTNVRTGAARAYSARCPAAGEQRDRHGDRRAAEQLAERRQQDRRGEQTDEDELEGVAQGRLDASREPDREREQRRRHQRDDEREQHDVARRAPAHDEELRLAAEQIEQRLRERERPQGGEVECPYARGRAS